MIRGVANSPHHWYAESPSPRITDTWSRRLPASTPRASDTVSCRLPVSLSRRAIRGVVFRIRISPRIRSQSQNDSKCSVRDLGQSDLCKNLGKFGSLPCPFNADAQLCAWRQRSVQFSCNFSLRDLTPVPKDTSFQIDQIMKLREHLFTSHWRTWKYICSFFNKQDGNIASMYSTLLYFISCCIRYNFVWKKYSKQQTVRALTYYMIGVKRGSCLPFVLFNSISF